MAGVTPRQGTPLETEQRASCREGDTSMDAHDQDPPQDSPQADRVSSPALGFERCGKSSLEMNPEPSPRLIGVSDVPRKRPTLPYRNGTTCKKAGVNAQSSVPVPACARCRRAKIRCDGAKPKCRSCARVSSACWSETSGPRNPGGEPPKLSEEVQKPEPACLLEDNQSSISMKPVKSIMGRPKREKAWSLSDDEHPIVSVEEGQKREPAQFLESIQSSDDNPRTPFPRDPKIFASPETPRTADDGNQQVHGLAYSRPLSAQSRKAWVKPHPQYAAHSQSTDGLSLVTALEPLQPYGATPLRTLLAKYYLLDAISQVKVENVNSCFDVVHAEPPIRPLAESIAWLYVKPPKPWLAIRRMIRNVYTDVLHDILDVLSDAKLYTDYVLFHTSARPTLGPLERQFACPALFDCIRVRQYMLNMLFREVQLFILKLSRPRVESGEEGPSDSGSVSDRQYPRKSVPGERERAQAALDLKRWLRLTSQRMWDRILHPNVQGKQGNCAVHALGLTRLSKLNYDDI